MKKVVIKNLSNIETHGAIFQTDEEIQSWIIQNESVEAWGKPAGEYNLSQLSEAELLTEISRRDVSDSGGNLLEPLVTIPAQYEIEITDITAEVEQEKINAEALSYLSSTDWYAIREAETGVQMPENIKQARAAARASIIK